MRFYIVDDDINIVRILTRIIEETSSFEVVGNSYNGQIAFNDILLLKPDIVLVDLFMPIMDGNTLVREIKSISPCVSFIMISQVLDSELRSESYKAGIEFFINKPINKIEVQKVISTVAERIEMESVLSNIKKMLKNSDEPHQNENDDLIKIKHILGVLGMLGEKGTTDIIKICLYLIKNKQNFIECNLDNLENYLGDNPQVVKQRIRRAVKDGLTNIANLGIEDYADDTFHIYSTVLFDFASVKAEMEYINGKRQTGGKISLSKFFEGLILKCENG